MQHGDDQVFNNALTYWDDVYTNSSYSQEISQKAIFNVDLAELYFGNLQNKKLLEIGCGGGISSVLFAERGANVTAIDASQTAISFLNNLCLKRSIKNVTAVVADALEPNRLGTFDFVYGSMILHHLEPFEFFAQSLSKAVRPGGKAFFYENSANSEMLMWFRDNIVGRFGIPKLSDPHERPLSRREIAEFQRYFSVTIDVQELVLFHLASMYLFGGRLKTLAGALDNILYNIPVFRPLSYRQYIKLDAQ